MCVNALQDPYNPLLEGTRRYGHNHEGALRDGAVASLVELAVVYVVMQPWKTGGRAWLRGLIALMAFVPWTLLSAVLTMHAGGVVMIHLLWLLALDVVLVGIVVGSLVSRASRR
jgi:apolipoprotein N-acyltransferase